jgi:hypothetical protein
MIHDESKAVGAVAWASLPGAAQCWLERALPRDLEVPASIQIEQEGTMEIKGRWAPFEAEGIYRAAPLSFEWQARFSVMPGVWIVAEDGHRDGEGWGGAKLWGIVPLGRRTGLEVLATQLVRNLAELVWLPPFVLVDGDLAWAEAGERAFEVRRHAGDRDVVVRFEIDEGGDVVRAWSPARVYDVPGGYAEAPWYYEFGEHRKMGGMRLPATATATFEKKDGPAEYFRGRVTAVTLEGVPS